MVKYDLKFDENINTKEFLQSSLNKYLDKGLIENLYLNEKISQIVFVKQESNSEKYTVEYKDKKVAFYGNDRSLIYALYDFLEKMGWNFFTPNYEIFLPYTHQLNFNKPFAYSYEPVFEYRLNLWDGLNDEWLVKNGINAVYGRILPETLGGGIGYAGLPVHTFGLLIPAKDYFETNPEFFAVSKDGKRLKKQLCLSNEKLFEEIIKNAKKWLNDNPKAQIISISQNDLVFTDCQCEKCKEIKKDGKASDVLVYFVNKVARELRKEYPNVKVQTIAYVYSVEAPKYYKPDDNVIIKLCPIESCENHSATDETCWRNKAFAKQLKEWNKVTNNIYLWKYYNDFNYYLTPFQCLADQRESYNFYAKTGVKGIFAEGFHAIGETTDFWELKAYVLAKLMFKPNMSEKEYKSHVKKFCENYYGKISGRCMLEYLKLLKTVSNSMHYECYPAPYSVISTNPHEEKNDKYFIKKAKSIFKKAFNNAESKECWDRIEKEYIAVLYFALYTNFENSMLNANKQKRKKILEEQNLLFELIDKHGIKAVRSFNSGIQAKKL